ncbi:MAG: DNA polymerase III subunit chi [Sterolibacterium sp.]|nr:DNA polymerase III subunit chi [Sterolibacterium sp.]
MTQVLFLHNAADRLHAAAAWLRQACDAGNLPIAIYSPDHQFAERLDLLLWTTPATSFLPHCRAHSPLATETPVTIATTADELSGLGPLHGNTLLNLADELPPEFTRFTQLVEIISQEAATRLPARERARHYRDQGHTIEYIDLQKSPLHTADDASITQ